MKENAPEISSISVLFNGEWHIAPSVAFVESVLVPSGQCVHASGPNVDLKVSTGHSLHGDGKPA